MEEKQRVAKSSLPAQHSSVVKAVQTTDRPPHPVFGPSFFRGRGRSFATLEIPVHVGPKQLVRLAIPPQVEGCRAWKQCSISYPASLYHTALALILLPIDPVCFPPLPPRPPLPMATLHGRRVFPRSRDVSPFVFRGLLGSFNPFFSCLLAWAWQFTRTTAMKSTVVGLGAFSPTSRQAQGATRQTGAEQASINNNQNAGPSSSHASSTPTLPSTLVLVLLFL